jgi:hypothetical protein
MHRTPSDGHVTVLATLPLAHQHQATPEQQIGHAQPRKLHAADARGIQDFQHGAVAQALRRAHVRHRQHAFHLGHRQHLARQSPTLTQDAQFLFGDAREVAPVAGLTMGPSKVFSSATASNSSAG